MAGVTPDESNPPDEGDDEMDPIADIDPESPARGVVDPDEEAPPEPSEPG